MGQFTISLPGNRMGDVRWGKVVKTASFFNLTALGKRECRGKDGLLN